MTLKRTHRLSNLILLTYTTLPWISARAAEPAHSPALISFDDLQKRLNDPNLRLLDLRPKAAFDKGHLPGAVWVDVKAAQELAAKPGAPADRAAWEAWIKPLGIGPDTAVFLYDANRQLDAARVWWLLRYLGVEQAGLINGGFALWEKEGRPVTADVRTIVPQPFAIRFQAERHATRDDVLAAIRGGKTQVVDARTAAEHTGADKRVKRAGHIPNACNLEWVNLVDNDGRFLAEPTLRAKLAESGVSTGAPVITHCQSGGRSSVNAFVFERLGLSTKNYYLGWSDWGNADETPITTSAAAAAKP
jgi:thiosulfate/3-mercaptopyruvate sulfurtransferase